MRQTTPNPAPITEKFREYLKIHTVANDLIDNLVPFLAEFDRLVEAHDAMALRLDALLKSPAGIAEVSASAMGKGAALSSPAAPSNHHGLGSGTLSESQEEIYRYVISRAQKDPKILQILMQKPELRVEVQAPVEKINGDTFFGRIAQLVQGKFFAEPKTVPVVLKEAIRRGWCSPKTPHIRVAEPLDKLTTMGFLTNEGKEVGYLAVAGTKISVVGA